MANRKECVFCGASNVKITNEHAWPNWMRALLPPTPTTVIGTRQAKKPITFVPRPDDMGVTANAMCKGCNEGWMNDLEDEVRPFLTPMIREGATVRLTPQQQWSLARWAVKTTMVFEFTCDRPPFYTFEQRDDLRNNRLPAATVIWAGRYEGTRFLSSAVAKGLIYDVTADGTTTRQPGNALTISVGQFVVQVLSIRPHEDIPALWVQMPRRFADHTVILWPRPTSDPLQWAPTSALTETELEEFMGRFAAEISVDKNQPS